jgi:putative ABC transport system ATP-binding protein
MLEFRGVAMTYPGPPPLDALKPCDLTVQHGEYVTVVGPSGSGKSTFLNVAGLLEAPTSGQYLIDGIDCTAVPDVTRTALRASLIGFVFQAFHLMPQRTVRENVELSMIYNRTPRTARRTRADAALKRVGLAHRMDALPVTLSGGERQRVAIARALAAEPAVLLCDEPTGNLDTATTASILETLDRLHQDGMTLIVITHDPQVAERGRRSVIIRDGVLSAL